jgi:hypothetical protein
VTAETWNTERVRQELGAKTIRSAGRIILRLGLKPIAREPGKAGMNLYDAATAGAAIAAHLARKGEVNHDEKLTED